MAVQYVTTTQSLPHREQVDGRQYSMSLPHREQVEDS